MPPPLHPFLFPSACLIFLPLVLGKDACPPYRRGRGHNRVRPRGCPLSLPLPLLCSCLFVLVPFPPSPTILICLSPSFFSAAFYSTLFFLLPFVYFVLVSHSFLLICLFVSQARKPSSLQRPQLQPRKAQRLPSFSALAHFLFSPSLLLSLLYLYTSFFLPFPSFTLLFILPFYYFRQAGELKPPWLKMERLLLPEPRLPSLSVSYLPSFLFVKATVPLHASIVYRLFMLVHDAKETNLGCRWNRCCMYR